MGCFRCKQRGEAIVRGVRSVSKGEIKPAASEVKFVAVSAGQDAAAAFRKSVTIAKSRLLRR